MCNEIFKLSREVKENGESELSLTVSMEVMKKALLSNLSGNEFKVYMALATFLDDRGECNPSQETIGTLCGMSTPTVNKAINAILKVHIGETPLLVRELVGKGSTKYSKYRIPKLGETVIPEVDKEVGLTAPAIIKLFQDEYFKKYGTPYKPNYRIEAGMVKNSMLPNFTDDQIRTIIETIFAEYDKRWKSPQYPSPTVRVMCGWMGTQALKIAVDKARATTTKSKFADKENSDEDLML